MSENGKASTKAKNKYNAKNYDNLRIVVQKGKKQVVVEVAKASGDTLNGYVKKAIKRQIKDDTGNDIEL